MKKCLYLNKSKIFFAAVLFFSFFVFFIFSSPTSAGTIPIDDGNFYYAVGNGWSAVHGGSGNFFDNNIQMGFYAHNSDWWLSRATLLFSKPIDYEETASTTLNIHIGSVNFATAYSDEDQLVLTVCKSTSSLISFDGSGYANAVGTTYASNNAYSLSVIYNNNPMWLAYELNAKGKELLASAPQVNFCLNLYSDVRNEVLDWQSYMTGIIYPNYLETNGNPAGYDPYISYDLVEQVATTSGEIYLGSRNCCAGQQCDIGIDFTEGLDGSTLHTELGLSPCYDNGAGDASYKLDFFNDLPYKITVESDATGTVPLCTWITGGTAVPFAETFSVNFYSGSTTLCDLSSTQEQYTNGFCEYPCEGIASGTPELIANLECWTFLAGCWLIKPNEDSIDYFLEGLANFPKRFPLAPFTKLYDDLNLAATGTQALAAGNISVPIYSTSSRTYQAQNFNISPNASTTSSYGWIKFRRLEVIAMWCGLCAAPIIALLLFLLL